MRKLFLALIVLLASVVAALWFRQQDGFVVMRVGDYAVQSSLIIFVAVVVAVWLVLSLLWVTLRKLWQTPRKLRGRMAARRRRNAHKRLVSGLIQVAEGHYSEAERTLLQKVGATDLPLVHYLLAAIAAHRRGSWDERDEYLGHADRSDPRARVAVGLLQAQLQIESEQWEQALATLSWLRERAPANPRALALLARCAHALEDWERLAQLLPELRRRNALRPRELDELERRVIEIRLNNAMGETDAKSRLAEVWQKLSREQRRDPTLQALYARCLIHAGENEAAEKLLFDWLQKDWDARLVQVWGELDGAGAQRRFARTEHWLRERPEDPELLAAAGFQAVQSELWGRARTYLEAAGARTGRLDVHRQLADLYDRLGETEKARQAYRRALGLAPGRRGLPLVAASPEPAAGG